MKRKYILFSFLLLLLFFMVYKFNSLAPILSGYGAKMVCSCEFISHRDIESVLQDELGAFPLWLGTFSVNLNDSSATGSVFGLAKATAIYRPGLGCTLVGEKKADEIKQDLPRVNFTRPPLSDTVYWPNGTLIADTFPEEIDRNILQKAVQEAFEEPVGKRVRKTRSVVVVYNGQLILEQYAPGFDKDMPQLGWSMTKSITTTLYAIMSQKGLVNIYDASQVPEWQKEGDPRKKITYDELLRMSSGLYWEEVYSTASPATQMLFQKADMGRVAALQEAQFPPDSVWYYSSGTTNLLSRQMRQIIGENDYYTFPYEFLFYPLGIRSAIIEPDASGTYVGSSYMWATARDWARLGQLYLNDGLWNGSRILPDGWVTYATTPTPKAPLGEYGAQFWLNAGVPGNKANRKLPDAPTDLYMMDGYEGQRVFIIPSYKLVIVRLGQNKTNDFDFNLWLREVLSAFQIEAQ